MIKNSIKSKKAKIEEKNLIIKFLGGVGEIGKNMTAFEYGNDIIVVDAGISFPTDDMPGVDVVVPDVKYLYENKERVKGIILTHGHEDHIGGVPYLLKEVNAPLYGTKLTLTLVQNKLEEHKIHDAELNAIEAGGAFKLGEFLIEFINVNHSIPGAVALSITTKDKKVFHTGDFKIDYTPVQGETTDLTRIGELGNEGVDLMLAESTNVEYSGCTVSEKEVGFALSKIFAENLKKRLIICMFASNVQRLQQVIDLALKYKRKIALSGRSMINVVDSASRIGELNVPDNIIIDIDQITKHKKEQIAIICTGTQGEPMSALSRMAHGEYKKVEIGENDTIVISASVIPGNEKLIYGVINNLYKKGAEVIYESLEPIHVSGHACQDELKLIHTLVKPKNFIPVHGEYRHLKKHANLAKSLGMLDGQILIPEIGDSIILSSKGIKYGEKFSAGIRLIDGDAHDDIESYVLQDRVQISEDGILMAVVCINALSEEYISCDIIAKGVTLTDGIIKEAKNNIENTLTGIDVKEDSDKSVTKRAIVKSIKNMIIKKTGKKPLIVPVVMKV